MGRYYQKGQRQKLFGTAGEKEQFHVLSDYSLVEPLYKPGTKGGLVYFAVSDTLLI